MAFGSKLLWAASALIVAATTGLWARNHWTSDVVCLTVPGLHLVQLESLDDGTFGVECYSRWPGGSVAQWTSGASSVDPFAPPPDRSVRAVARIDWPFFGTGAREWRGWGVETSPVAVELDAAGHPRVDFGYADSEFGPSSGPVPMTPALRHWGAEVPILALPVIGSLPSAAVACTAGLTRLRSRARYRRGRCVRCGYDRRHSPDRCPECGAAAGANPAVHSRLP